MVLVVLIALGVGGGLVGSRYAQIDRDSDLLLQELDACRRRRTITSPARRTAAPRWKRLWSARYARLSSAKK